MRTYEFRRFFRVMHSIAGFVAGFVNMNEHILSLKRLFLYRNRRILGEHNRRLVTGKVNYEYWSPSEMQEENLGDYLAVVVNEWMLDREGIRNESVPGIHFFASIGSVLSTGFNTTTVWGSGLLNEHPSRLLNPITKKMDIRALRGPMTKIVLESRGYDCPEVFGDPACLMPLIYQPPRTHGDEHEAEAPLVLIKHHLAGHLKGQEQFKQLSILTTDYRNFINQIVGSRLVISSSLHGIILAESYRIPAVLLDDGRKGFSLFKYQDWYYSTGRLDFPVAHSIAEALEVSPPPLPDLRPVQDQLLSTFPYDIWDH